MPWSRRSCKVQSCGRSWFDDQISLILLSIFGLISAATLFLHTHQLDAKVFKFSFEYLGLHIYRHKSGDCCKKNSKIASFGGEEQSSEEFGVRFVQLFDCVTDEFAWRIEFTYN